MFKNKNHLKIDWHQWLVILATWEAEIPMIAVPGQPRQIVWESPSPKLSEQSELEAWLKQ
jgi:hypothetical protein